MVGRMVGWWEYIGMVGMIAGLWGGYWDGGEDSMRVGRVAEGLVMVIQSTSTI